MTRSKILIVVCLLLQIVLSSCTESKKSAKPNIILIYADDLGYGDLSSYGGDIPTPNIDRIGEEGIRFTDFYVSAPACTPSRFSLLTGSYPQRSQHGLNEVLMPGRNYHFDSNEVTLAELLKSQGYNTVLIGKWHLGSKKKSYYPSHNGFEEFTGFLGGCIDYFYHLYGAMGPDWYIDGKVKKEKGYSTDLITKHALDFIDQAKGQDNPFFLYLPYNAPHYGKTDPDSIHAGTVTLKTGNYKGYDVMNTLQAPEKYISEFDSVDDKYRRVYSAMVSNLDDNIGRLLEKLKTDKVYQNTMIWFISDNGGYSESYHGHSSNGKLRGEKATVWEGGIRIPAMVSWKNKIESGQVVHQPLANIDLVPTLGSIIGYEDKLSDLPVDGIDISKVLFKREQVKRDLFWKFRGQTAFRRGKWKLVDSTKLFNLHSDISEETNVASKYPEKVKELKKAFQKIDTTFKENE